MCIYHRLKSRLPSAAYEFRVRKVVAVTQLMHWDRTLPSWYRLYIYLLKINVFWVNSTSKIYVKFYLFGTEWDRRVTV